MHSLEPRKQRRLCHQDDRAPPSPAGPRTGSGEEEGGVRPPKEPKLLEAAIGQAALAVAQPAKPWHSAPTTQPGLQRRGRQQGSVGVASSLGWRAARELEQVSRVEHLVGSGGKDASIGPPPLQPRDESRPLAWQCVPCTCYAWCAHLDCMEVIEPRDDDICDVVAPQLARAQPVASGRQRDGASAPVFEARFTHDDLGGDGGVRAKAVADGAHQDLRLRAHATRQAVLRMGGEGWGASRVLPHAALDSTALDLTSISLRS